MGLFDRFKGESTAGRPAGGGNQPASRFGLAEAIAAYWLKEVEPYEPSIEGTWWEGASGTTRGMGPG